MFLIYIVDIFCAMPPTIAVSVIKSIFPFLFFFLVYPHMYQLGLACLRSRSLLALCRCNNSCPGYIHGPLYLMPSLNFCQVASGNVDSLLHCESTAACKILEKVHFFFSFDAVATDIVLANGNPVNNAGRMRHWGSFASWNEAPPP